MQPFFEKKKGLKKSVPSYIYLLATTNAAFFENLQILKRQCPHTFTV
jgi:hypothetical protein